MQWDVFFGPENVEALRWEALSATGSAARAALQPFLDLVERRAPIAALPRKRPGGSVHWYIGWRDASDARFAMDFLWAFLGRTYAVMQEPLRTLVPADAAETAFAEEFEGRVLRLEVKGDERCRTDARDQLLRLANLLLDRPTRLAARVRPVGRILRDFELALLARDDDLAGAEIETLRAGGHLDEANLAFLALRRLGARKDWAGLLGQEALPSLLGFQSLPWKVRGVLVEALHHTHLAKAVEQDQVAEALMALGNLLPEYQVAFQSRRHLAGVEAVCCFLLVDELRGTARPEDVDGALQELESGGCAAFAAAFRAHLAAKAPGGQVPLADAIEDAQRALADHDLDRAFDIAVACAGSLKRARTLLQCARLLDDGEVARKAIEACDNLPALDREALFSFVWCKTNYEQIRSELGAPFDVVVRNGEGPSTSPTPETGAFAINSWPSWFARLRCELPWPGAVAQAARGVKEWSVENVASDPEALAGIASTLEASLAEWAAVELHNSIPYFLEAFLGDPPDPRLMNLVSTLFELLATDVGTSLPAIAALLKLADARLNFGAGKYQETMETLVDAIEQQSSPRTVRLVAEMLEMLITMPCPTPKVRLSVAVRLASLAHRWWTRIDAGDRAMMIQLCKELEIETLLPSESRQSASEEEAGTDWGSALTGRFIAMYSLTPSATDRARNVILAACPEVRVKAYCELDSTPSMKEAARTADLFIIVTRSAKHAATEAIMKNRVGRTVEYAGGKGSASIIEALRRWIDGGAVNSEN